MCVYMSLPHSLHDRFTFSLAVGASSASPVKFLTTRRLQMTCFNSNGNSWKACTRFTGAPSNFDWKLAVKKVKLQRCRKWWPHHCASAICEGMLLYFPSPTTGQARCAMCKRIWCRRPVKISSCTKLQARSLWERCWTTITDVWDCRPRDTTLGLCWSLPNQCTAAFTWCLLGGSQAWQSTM